MTESPTFKLVWQQIRYGLKCFVDTAIVSTCFSHRNHLDREPRSLALKNLARCSLPARERYRVAPMPDVRNAVSPTTFRREEPSAWWTDWELGVMQQPRCWTRALRTVLAVVPLSMVMRTGWWKWKTSKYGDWRVCTRKTRKFTSCPVSSESLSGSAVLVLGSSSGVSSKMSAICQALAIYWRSWSGRKLLRRDRCRVDLPVCKVDTT